MLYLVLRAAGIRIWGDLVYYKEICMVENFDAVTLNKVAYCMPRSQIIVFHNWMLDNHVSKQRYIYNLKKKRLQLRPQPNRRLVTGYNINGSRS